MLDFFHGKISCPIIVSLIIIFNIIKVKHSLYAGFLTLTKQNNTTESEWKRENTQLVINNSHTPHFHYNTVP